MLRFSFTSVVLLTFACRLSGQSVSVELSYSDKFYDNSFYAQLPSRSSISLFQAPHWIGVHAVEHALYGAHGQMAAAVSMEQMLPYTITINDSIRAKMTGFSMGLPLFGFDLLRRSKMVDFLIVAGANVGRLGLGGDDRVRSKNPFISPKLLVMPRIALGKLVISAKAEYSYDVSEKQWKNRMFGPKHTAAIQSFNQSGLTFGVSAGLLIH
jgi:hypothetical protein